MKHLTQISMRRLERLDSSCTGRRALYGFWSVNYQ
jgi:hypothetical protein